MKYLKKMSVLFIHLDMSPSCAMAKVPVTVGLVGFLVRIQNMNMLLIHAVAHKTVFPTIGNDMCIYSHAHMFIWLLCVLGLERPNQSYLSVSVS